MRALVTREVDTLVAALDQARVEILRANPRYAQLAERDPLTVAVLQESLLDSTSALLQYELGEERSYLLVLTRDTVAAFALPPKAEMERAVREYYNHVTARTQRVAGEGAAAWRARIRSADEAADRRATSLSALLLTPARGLLAGKRLLIAPDEALQFLPFGALPDPEGGGRLALQREIAVLPSGSAALLLQQRGRERTIPPKAVAVFADPVFDARDRRVRALPIADSSGSDLNRSAAETRALDDDGRLPRLSFAAAEARAILRLVPPGQRFAALDLTATAATVLAAPLREYRVVHFATHALLNDVHPELSGIALSMVDASGAPVDGFLRLHQIYSLDLPVELVVLSACQTAMGPTIGGEGPVSLARAFMAAGAQRVVASLWKVDDEATAAFMTHFYRSLLQDYLTPAAALRAAQRSLSVDPRWRSPFYWAAFVLQGDLR